MIKTVTLESVFSIRG